MQPPLISTVAATQIKAEAGSPTCALSCRGKPMNVFTSSGVPLGRVLPSPRFAVLGPFARRIPIPAAVVAAPALTICGRCVPVGVVHVRRVTNRDLLALGAPRIPGGLFRPGRRHWCDSRCVVRVGPGHAAGDGGADRVRAGIAPVGRPNSRKAHTARNCGGYCRIADAIPEVDRVLRRSQPGATARLTMSISRWTDSGRSASSGVRVISQVSIA